MKEKCLVSIITACYNGERFIDQYMESILQQTYSDIELILVNDGSTDLSEKKILSYKDKLSGGGIKLEYIFKSNGGHPSAINAGLKRCHGKYLTWPDIDDVMYKDYIRTKTLYMEEHPDVDYLITPSAVVDIKNPKQKLYYTWKNPPKSKQDMLYRIISGKNYNYEAGSFFITSEIFRKTHPQGQIYDACGKWSGPHIQIMLPIIYSGQYGYLDKCLFDYYLHEGNDHNKYKSKKEMKVKCSEGYKLLMNTIESIKMPLEEKEYYMKQALLRMKKKEMNAAAKNYDIEWYSNVFKELGKEASLRDRVKLLILKYATFRHIDETIKHIARKGD